MRVRFRILRPVAQLMQRRRIATCERHGGSRNDDGSMSGKCRFPYDHYPYWTVKVELS